MLRFLTFRLVKTVLELALFFPANWAFECAQCVILPQIPVVHNPAAPTLH